MSGVFPPELLPDDAENEPWERYAPTEAEGGGM